MVTGTYDLTKDTVVNVTITSPLNFTGIDVKFDPADAGTHSNISMVWGPMPSNKRAAMYKRLMQKYYVNALLDLYTGDRASSALLHPGTARFDDNADILSMAYYQLVELQKKLASLRGAEADMAHYRYLSDLIDRKLELGHLSGYNI